MDQSVKSIGIVGGGKVGLQLFGLFSQSSLTKVVFVTDVNVTAPALMEARKAGVETFTDLSLALGVPVDFIFEVTGIPRVVEELQNKVDQTKCRLITHDMAYIILRVNEENSQKLKVESVQQIQGIKVEIDHHLDKINHLVDGIEDIASQMRLLAINARIEAAQVGEKGKGFAVVAAEMGKSSNSVMEITEEIQRINDAIQSTSDRIEESLERLR